MARGNGTDPGTHEPLMRGGPIVRSLERWKYLNVALVLACLGAVAGFYEFVETRAEAAGRQGLDKATQLEAKLDEHIKEESALHEKQTQQLQQIQTQNAADAQALYRFLLTRERQPRLERVLDAGLSSDGGP